MKKDVPQFPGFRRPLSDFGAVKTDFQTPLLMYELDLSSARTIAAGTAAVLKFAGNSFYIDKNTDVGEATVVFQDDSNLRPARVFVQPGFIARVPWTNLIIENTAQPGKTLRIFYGVDVDFVPGTSADVQINGTVDVDLQPYSNASGFASTTALAANTAETIVSAGTNANGVIVYEATFSTGNAGTLPRACFTMNGAAPTTILNGRTFVTVDNNCVVAGFYNACGKLRRPILIPAGLGIHYICDQAESIPYRSVLYTVL